MKNLIEYFTNDSYTTEAALFSLILGVMTLQIGLGAVQLRSSPYMNATIRELFADFGLASAGDHRQRHRKLGQDSRDSKTCKSPLRSRRRWIEIGG
jgi:hypothetical protein